MIGRSPITTHVLDTALGRPAEGVEVELARQAGGRWEPLATGTTDRDGRVTDLLSAAIQPGTYRLVFATGEYHQRTAAAGNQALPFYPQVTVEFHVHDPTAHYHVPLLLSPYGYSTYRGS